MLHMKGDTNNFTRDGRVWCYTAIGQNASAQVGQSVILEDLADGDLKAATVLAVGDDKVWLDVDFEETHLWTNADPALFENGLMRCGLCGEVRKIEPEVTT